MAHHLRKFFLFTFLVSAFISGHSFGQTKQLKIPKNDFWYKYNQKKIEKLYLSDLTVSNDEYHWRFWFNGQTVSYAIDLVNDSNKLTAFITPYTEEYTFSDEPPTNRIYTYKVPLADSTAKKILLLLKDTEINSIPNQDEIEGWGRGLDGVTYCIENATRINYSFKSYWSPKGSDISEAKVVIGFINSIENITNIKDVLSNFNKHIPFESYTTDGSRTALKVLTYEQRLYYKRDRDRYRKNTIKQSN